MNNFTAHTEHISITLRVLTVGDEFHLLGLKIALLNL